MHWVRPQLLYTLSLDIQNKGDKLKDLLYSNLDVLRRENVILFTLAWWSRLCFKKEKPSSAQHTTHVGLKIKKGHR